MGGRRAKERNDLRNKHETHRFVCGYIDPPTLGHKQIIDRALSLVDELIVGVAVNPAKSHSSQR